MKAKYNGSIPFGESGELETVGMKGERFKFTQSEVSLSSPVSGSKGKSHMYRSKVRTPFFDISGINSHGRIAVIDSVRKDNRGSDAFA